MKRLIKSNIEDNLYERMQKQTNKFQITELISKQPKSQSLGSIDAWICCNAYA